MRPCLEHDGFALVVHGESKKTATINSFITLTNVGRFAATYPRCGGQRGMSFVANFLENTTVKGF